MGILQHSKDEVVVADTKGVVKPIFYLAEINLWKNLD
jgi:hypothetical protein